MNLLLLSTDKVQVITSAAAAIDTYATFMDADLSNPPVVQGDTSSRQVAFITTATTTDIVAAPAASTLRNVKSILIRNTEATLACDVTIVVDISGVDTELIKVTLLAGETLEFIEGVGFFVPKTTSKLDVKLYVTADSVHATAATFADVTGLTYPVENGKHYCFEAHLFHISNATTTGAQFGINGPTMTGLQIGTIDTVTGSVTAGVMSTGATAALNTAATAQTTGSAAITLGILSGWFNPSAAGTFAIRATSEVTVASGLIVKKGSWLRLWEVPA